MWKTTGFIHESLENEIKYAIYEPVSNKQYFVCMFSRNDIGDSNKTNVKQAKHFGKYLAAKMEIGC